jgi:hypothetical protein
MRQLRLSPYKSAFGADAFSVALFDIDDAKQVNRTLYRTDGVEFKFAQTGNTHFAQDK